MEDKLCKGWMNKGPQGQVLLCIVDRTKMWDAKLFERGGSRDRFCCTFAFESCSKAGLLFHHHNIVKPSMSERIL